MEYGMSRMARRKANWLPLIPLLCGLFGGQTAAAMGLTEILQGISWGEPRNAVIERFGTSAMLLPRPLDFGDSYAKVVVRDVAVGGVPLIAFFQMDKATGGLKRIQLERQRHGVNPPAFRGVVVGLEDVFGAPDTTCAIAPGPMSGYQAATEAVWSRGGNLVRAIFRDTTIQAYEGCINGDLSAGPCGLTGQLIVRISPPGADLAGCRAPRRPR
jgi:hypothetical protein